MIIDSIHITNFKCFRKRTAIDLKGINLLTGTNGRGKSTMLQTLLLMRQSTEHNRNTRQVILNGSCIEIGNFADLKNSKTSTDEPVIFSFRFKDLNCNLVVIYFLNEIENDKTVAQISTIKVHGVYNGKNLSFSLFNKPKGIFLSTGPNKKQTFLGQSFYDLFITDNIIGSELDIIYKILNFNRIHYVSADRIGPQDFYPKTSFTFFPNVGAKGQFTINLLHKKKDDRVYKDLCINEKVPDFLLDQSEAWLSYIFGSGKIQIFDTNANIFTMGMNHDGSSTVYRPANLGFGFSYILPIIVSGLIAKEGEILIVENPEAHLHSSSQSRLIEFLAKVSKNGVQVFVETHSDHVLNALRVCVKQDYIGKDDLNVLYFQSNEEEQVVTIPILENARIEKWPVGFFDQMDKDFEILFND